ncbi:MAG: TIGR03618 family F420-dependent PPOX class oxidoreductase [Gaiella sp.]
MELPQSAKDVITSGRLAHLVTRNEDGSAQVTCVWVGLEGDTIVSAHLSPSQRKIANVRRDPRVALSIETDVVNEWGLQEYLVVKGTATLTPGGAPELLQQLAHVYLGPDVTFPNMPDPPPGHILRVEPTWLGGIGPWAG